MVGASRWPKLVVYPTKIRSYGSPAVAPDRQRTADLLGRRPNELRSTWRSLVVFQAATWQRAVARAQVGVTRDVCRGCDVRTRASALSRRARGSRPRASGERGRGQSLPLDAGLEGSRRQPRVERPRAVEPADQTCGGLVELSREGQPVLELERQGFRQPAAPRETGVLGDDGVVDHAQPPIQEHGVRFDLGQPVAHVEEPPHVSPRRAKGSARQLERLDPAVATVSALTHHQAGIAEVLDSELPVVGEPPIERVRVGLGPVEEIAIPHSRGLDRVVGRGVEQERVAARALQPATRALGRVVRIERPAIRTEANAPGASTAGVARTTSSETASPRMPPSRNRYAPSGETT